MFTRFVLPIAFLACACGSSAPARSPAPQPAVETSTGHTLGADRTSPDEKLKTSPRVGSKGFEPAETPGSVEGGSHGGGSSK